MEDNILILKASVFSIVSNLIFSFNFNSMFKIVISSFILMNDSDISRVRGKFDLVPKFLLNIGYLLPNNNRTINDCFESFQILKNNGFISIDGDKITVLKQPEIISQFLFKGVYLFNCLEQINLLSDQSFLFEVMRNV